MTKARNLSNFIGGNYDAPTGSLDNVTSVPSVITALDAKVVQTGTTGSAVVPSGNTAQRGSGTAGHFRFNTTDNQFEGYNGTAWGAVGGYTGFRNRIINGDMRIDQRNAGASVTGNPDVYSLDRWKCVAAQSSKYTVQQVVDAPSGFINSLKVTSSSSYSVGASEHFGVRQIIEGYNEADWYWPNVGGQTITLSFWVKSSLTGTFGGSVFSSADNYIFSYSISSVNTWEYKTVTVSAPTAGTWPTGNTGGASIFWSLGSGADLLQAASSWYYSNARRSVTGEIKVVSNNASTWQITGVQLEEGSVATPFERRPYGTELALCQRYYQLIGSGASGVTQSSVAVTVGWINRVEMRAAPTIALYSTALRIRHDGSASFTSSGSTMPDYSADQYGGWVVVNGFTGLTITRSAITFPTTAAFTLSSEL